MKDDCIHEKVYAQYMLTVYPPMFPWICKLCGQEGFDEGNYERQEYQEIKDKFKTPQEKT
jgi:hypothetical protein